MSVWVTDKDGSVLKELPIANLESLSLLGSVQVSTQAVQVFAENSIPIAYLSPAGRLLAIIEPHDSVSAEVRRQQVRRFDNAEDALQLTRALVAAKISNQRTLLLRNHPSLPSSVPGDLAREAEQAARAGAIDTVRGHEGQAAAIYFAHYAGMFRKRELAQQFDANGRQRRPPPDPINSCLSMAYTMLTHECVAALRLASLEPSIGAFHASRPGRPALALDLMEPFRPLIADSVAIAAFNRGELAEGHFTRTAAGCLLSESGRRAFCASPLTRGCGRRASRFARAPTARSRLGGGASGVWAALPIRVRVSRDPVASVGTRRELTNRPSTWAARCTGCRGWI